MRIPRSVVVLLLTLSLTGSLYARHRSSPPSMVQEIEGVLKSINATQLVVTDNHNTDVTINITPDTVFRSEDMAIAPADLKAGDRVAVKAVEQNNALNALLVQVENEPEQEPQVLELSGSIKSISGNDITITDAQGNDTTVTVTPATLIRKGDVPATAADLAVGDRVEVKAVKTATATNALVINDEENEQQMPQLVEVDGTIKNVSSTQIIVTDAQQNDTTFTITNMTLIRKGDRLATTSDLAIGDRVQVKGMVNGTTKTALFINDETEPPEQQEVEISGAVKSTASDHIVVTTRSGDVTVNVDSNTRIRKDDRAITISDIHVGDQVSAEGTSVNSTTILAREIEVRTSGGDH